VRAGFTRAVCARAGGRWLSRPAGRLLTVGRRRAIDAFRRRAALDERYAALARDLGEGGAAHAGPAADGADLLWDPDRIDDDVLALVFISCHPVLSREARVALTLRVVGGLTSDEIARAFLVPAATVQARITRAKKTLAAAQVPFAVPPAAERAERLGSVLSVIYLVFTEGSSASSGRDLIRLDLAGEGQRLARVLDRLMPDEPEVHGLLALLELTAARFPARTGPDGEPVLLDEQDRGRWDQAAIRRGADGALPGSHLLPSVRGELLIRLGRYDEARAELGRAVDLCGSEPERTVLRRKIAGIARRA
jgi:predicted RNA polymerase sigma factor